MPRRSDEADFWAFAEDRWPDLIAEAERVVGDRERAQPLVVESLAAVRPQWGRDAQEQPFDLVANEMERRAGSRASAPHRVASPPAARLPREEVEAASAARSASRRRRALVGGGLALGLVAAAVAAPALLDSRDGDSPRPQASATTTSSEAPGDAQLPEWARGDATAARLAEWGPRGSLRNDSRSLGALMARTRQVVREGPQLNPNALHPVYLGDVDGARVGVVCGPDAAMGWEDDSQMEDSASPFLTCVSLSGRAGSPVRQLRGAGTVTTDGALITLPITTGTADRGTAIVLAPTDVEEITWSKGPTYGTDGTVTRRQQQLLLTNGVATPALGAFGPEAAVASPTSGLGTFPAIASPWPDARDVPPGSPEDGLAAEIKDAYGWTVNGVVTRTVPLPAGFRVEAMEDDKGRTSVLSTATGSVEVRTVTTEEGYVLRSYQEDFTYSANSGGSYQWVHRPFVIPADASRRPPVVVLSTESDLAGRVDLEAVRPDRLDSLPDAAVVISDNPRAAGVRVGDGRVTPFADGVAVVTLPRSDADAASLDAPGALDEVDRSGVHLVDGKGRTLVKDLPEHPLAMDPYAIADETRTSLERLQKQLAR